MNRPRQAGEVLKEMLKPKVLSLVQDLFSMTESEDLSPARPAKPFGRVPLLFEYPCLPTGRELRLMNDKIPFFGVMTQIPKGGFELLPSASSRFSL